MVLLRHERGLLPAPAVRRQWRWPSWLSDFLTIVYTGVFIFRSGFPVVSITGSPVVSMTGVQTGVRGVILRGVSSRENAQPKNSRKTMIYNITRRLTYGIQNITKICKN